MYHWLNVAFNKKYNFSVTINKNDIVVKDEMHGLNDTQDILFIVRPTTDKMAKTFLIIVKNNQFFRYKITYLNSAKICAAILRQTRNNLELNEL